MTDREIRGAMTEERLTELLAEHYAPVSPPEGFEQTLLAELESEYTRLQPPAQRGWGRRMLRHIPRPRLAIPAALAVVAAVVALVVLLPPRDVLAETARKMRTVQTLHYTLTITGQPEQGIREIWWRGNQTYACLRVGDRIVGKMWLSFWKTVTYDVTTNKVTIKPSSRSLFDALSGVQQLRHIEPEKWRLVPVAESGEAGRNLCAYETPGAGKFTGLGTSGDTKMRLWIDPKTALPARMEMRLRTSPEGEWESSMCFTFFWDDDTADEGLFEPTYPDDAEIVTIEPPRPTPAKAAPRSDASEPAPSKPAANAKGDTDVVLEKAWVHPAGLVILRCALNGRQPFGDVPRLADPARNPWGLRPEEIRDVVNGQLILDPPCQTRFIAIGGMPKRRAGYLVFRFAPWPDGTNPAQLRFRYLLPPTRWAGIKDMNEYIETVLNDPACWKLYDLSVPVAPNLTDRIPEEIYASPNLPLTGPFQEALRDIVRACEAQSPARARQFLKAQGPHTQELLKEEMERLVKE